MGHVLCGPPAFLTGQQQALFDGLCPKYVGGIAPVTGPDDNGYPSGTSSTGVIPSEGPAGPESRDPFGTNEPSLFNGIHGKAPGGAVTGHIHAADALKELIDTGDAPSCSVCSAIMTRNGRLVAQVPNLRLCPTFGLLLA